MTHRDQQSKNETDYLSTSDLTTVNRLADAEKDFDKVRESWSRAKTYCQSRSIDLGVLIFSAVFAQQSKLKTIFGIPLNVEAKEMPKDSPFKHHAHVFANMIDLVVRSCNDLESQVEKLGIKLRKLKKVKPALVTFGGRHYTKHKVDFENVYLAAFAKAIVQITGELNHLVTENDLSKEIVWDDRTDDMWHLITVYVVHQMKHGYDEQLSMDKHHKSPRHSISYNGLRVSEPVSQDDSTNNQAIGFMKNILGMNRSCDRS